MACRVAPSHHLNAELPCPLADRKAENRVDPGDASATAIPAINRTMPARERIDSALLRGSPQIVCGVSPWLRSRVCTIWATESRDGRGISAEPQEQLPPTAPDRATHRAWAIRQPKRFRAGVMRDADHNKLSIVGSHYELPTGLELPQKTISRMPPKQLPRPAYAGEIGGPEGSPVHQGCRTWEERNRHGVNGSRSSLSSGLLASSHLVWRHWLKGTRLA